MCCALLLAVLARRTPSARRQERQSPSDEYPGQFNSLGQSAEHSPRNGTASAGGGSGWGSPKQPNRSVFTPSSRAQASIDFLRHGSSRERLLFAQPPGHIPPPQNAQPQAPSPALDGVSAMANGKENGPLLPTPPPSWSRHVRTSSNTSLVSIVDTEPGADDNVKLSEISLFPRAFWVLCFILVNVYGMSCCWYCLCFCFSNRIVLSLFCIVGTVVPWHSIASDFLQEKWYHNDPTTAGRILGRLFVLLQTGFCITETDCGTLLASQAFRTSFPRRVRRCLARPWTSSAHAVTSCSCARCA